MPRSLAILLAFATVTAHAADCARAPRYGVRRRLRSRSRHAFYVAPDGDDSNAGAIDSPWATIQRAADTIAPGDVACVRGGTYREIVTVTRSGFRRGRSDHAAGDARRKRAHRRRRSRRSGRPVRPRHARRCKRRHDSWLRDRELRNRIDERRADRRLRHRRWHRRAHRIEPHSRHPHERERLRSERVRPQGRRNARARVDQ